MPLVKCPRVLTWPLLTALAVLSLAARATCDEPTLAEVEYDPGQTPAPGTSSRLFITGAALTAGWYGAAVGASYLWRDAPNARRLRLPVVGPYAALGRVGCGSDEDTCNTVTVVLRTSLAVFSAVGQTGGVLAMIESLFVPSAAAQTSPPRVQREPSAAATVDWYPQPLIAEGDALGLAVGGAF